jgi:hypothetical protein
VACRVTGSAAPTPTPTPVPVTPAYVQGNYAAPQTPQTTITVPYTAAQKAGDLNVVIVGWNDSTTQLTGLGDSVGNIYQLAVGPTVLAGTPGLSQVIVFASNISGASAGANAVTLTFNAAATYPDVRILEYSGISSSGSLDVATASTGNSASSNSGSVTTTNAADLLVGVNIVWSGTSGPGSGWTQRIMTSPDGDIVEDQVVTATGSYIASAPLVSGGPWIMQMAAFRSATSGSTTTSSPPSQNLGSSVVLTWNADSATSDSGTNATGYRLHWGSASGVYTQTQDAGNNLTATVSSLTSGTTYYFVVTAYNSAGVDSSPSNEISYTAP